MTWVEFAKMWHHNLRPSFNSRPYPPLASFSLSPSLPLSFHAALGAAYGTAKSGVGIAAMSVMRPDLIMKSVIPVVMAGIIAIYGLVVAVLVANKCKWPHTPYIVSFHFQRRPTLVCVCVCARLTWLILQLVCSKLAK